MGGIFSAFQMSLANLSNMRAGIAVVNENVSNLNNPGYSQRRIIFKSEPGQVRPYGIMGTGAAIDSVEAVRSSFVEERLRSETETAGFFQGQQMPVTQIEAIYTDTGGAGIGTQLSRFFDSWLELSNDSTSIPLREAVIAEGQQTAYWIRNTAQQLDNLDMGNRAQIQDVVRDVNALLDELAQLDEKLGPMLAQGTDGGTLFDDRNRLVRELSGLIDINTYMEAKGTQVITTSSGKLLLAGMEAYHLDTEGTGSGQIVTYNGVDIGSEIHAGKLGGLLDFQNNVLGSFRTSLNDLARELASAVNSAHSQGATLNAPDDQAGDFFSVVAGNEAKSIGVEISDPAEIGARILGEAVGDATNARALSDLRNTLIGNLDNQTFSEFYSDMVFQIGLITRGVNGNLDLQDRIVTELESLRASISGVSLDEEAVKLIQFQRSYQASSKLIKAIDDLVKDTLNIIQ